MRLIPRHTALPARLRAGLACASTATPPHCASDAPALPIVVGWREWVTLPALGIARVRAKVDTGARSSALHVDAQWRFFDGGVPWVGFRLTSWKADGAALDAAAPILEERAVTDSGGHTTRRIFLRTVLRLAGREREIEVTLTDRAGMRYPMLLGRTALAGMFAVDPARSSVHGRPPRQLACADGLPAPTDGVPPHISHLHGAGTSAAVWVRATVLPGA